MVSNGIEAHRYELEPFIHSVAQFTRSPPWSTSELEVGVGAVTGSLRKRARAGLSAIAGGFDRAEAIEVTRARLALYTDWTQT